MIGLALLWLCGLLLGLSSFLRPPLPIDETRYLSVAWDMWSRHQFVVPILNGHIYAHKPPLLFWLVHLSWIPFGANASTPRLIVLLFGLGAVFLTIRMAGELFPEHKGESWKAGLFLLSFPIWALWMTLFLFDIPLSFFVALTGVGMLWVVKGRSWRGSVLLTLAVAGGLLTKGPVFYVHALAIALALALSGIGERPVVRWLGPVMLAVLVGSAVVGSWLGLVVKNVGIAFVREVLFRQTLGRMTRSFAHARPVWWYLWTIPILGFPWVLGMRIEVVKRLWKTSPGLRFVGCWAGLTLILFSLISGKQIYYLLPALVPVALGVFFLERNRAIDVERIRWIVKIVLMAAVLGMVSVKVVSGYGRYVPWWLIALSLFQVALLWRREAGIVFISLCIVATVSAVNLGPVYRLARDWDLTEAGKYLKRFQEEGRPVAVFPEKYAGQFRFAGRLKADLVEIPSPRHLWAWAWSHPDGVVVSVLKRPLPMQKEPLWQAEIRGKWVGIYFAKSLLGSFSFAGDLVEDHNDSVNKIVQK